MNEWKSRFFLFPVCFFFSHQKFEWMNDPKWPMNFSVEKKKTKNTEKIAGKKKHKHLLLKKMERHQNLIEWPMNFSWEKKKTSCIFFFPASRKKKNTRFSDLNEWMTNVHVRVKKKIRYLWKTQPNDSELPFGWVFGVQLGLQ